MGSNNEAKHQEGNRPVDSNESTTTTTTTTTTSTTTTTTTTTTVSATSGDPAIKNRPGAGGA